MIVLAKRLLAPGDAHDLVVDEGPGPSGSSFGAVVSFLERAGVARGRCST